MIDLPTETLQLLFIDTLFLCVCGALCLWLRNWIKFQQREIENRLSILERHHDMIAELGKRLQSTTYAIEKMNVSLSNKVMKVLTSLRHHLATLPLLYLRHLTHLLVGQEAPKRIRKFGTHLRRIIL